MNRKTRTTLMTLGISLVAAVATQARAEEQSYYKGKSWEVLLNTPDTAGETPYCVLRSSNLAEKSVAIEYNLTGIDETTPSLRIIKRNWGLPIGEVTKVAISTRWAGGVGFDATVLNSDELYGEFPQQSAGDRGFMLGNILGTVIRTVKPAPLVVVFEGNEPMWLVPSVDFGEAMSLGSEFKDCLTALKKLGPSLYNTAETSKTSPFNKQPGQSGFNFGITPGNSNPPFQTSPEASKTAEPAPPASSWTFEKREEDWGDTCYVETTQSDMLVGFMGAPGKDLVAFVENGFTGSVTTTWKIDGGGSYVSDGDVADYSGWHEFYGLPKDILTDAKNGKQLTVSDTGGKTIGLASASTPFSQFIECFNKAPPKAEAETTNDDSAENHDVPNRRTCLLEVGGKKAIDGACYWGQYGPDKDSIYLQANGYFAYIEIDQSTADGWWNETPGSTHAHSKPGEMKRDGQCWKNKTVRLCPGTE